MAQALSDALVKALPTPATGNRVTYDAGPKRIVGFGIRVTAAGARTFILNYRTAGGRERRFSIGAYPAWNTTAAREEAKRLRQRVDQGHDPLEEVQERRTAPTVADLCDRFKKEHAAKKRDRTEHEYGRLVDDAILPALKHKKVADVTFEDIDRLHRQITTKGTTGKKGAPYVANRMLAVLSKMFALAVKWKMRPDNPVRGVERNHEAKRQRYINGAELGRLVAALAAHDDRQAANIVRLLLLTGARRGELMSAKWEDFDLKAGVWTKPGATTKQKTEHRLPISAPARQLLSEIKAGAPKDAEYVFPGRTGPHRVEIKRAWQELCIAAGLVKTETVADEKGRPVIVVKPSVRLHDLRHTHASFLASGGASLPQIGALLGHTQTSTTARYAHLFDETQRQATDKAASEMGFIATGAEPAEVVELESARR